MAESVSAGSIEGLDHDRLVVLAVELLARVDRLEVDLAEARAANDRLVAEVEKLRAQKGRNSGNSSKPPSTDDLAERKRQAEERKKHKDAKAAAGKRSKGKQRGGAGFGPKLTPDPDKVVDHLPDACSGCGADLGNADGEVTARRQVIDLPVPAPVITEHRAHSRRCSCGHVTTGSFPAGVRAPVSFSPAVKAVVVYLLARQHIPVERVRETMRDLYGIKISAGSINSFYTEASTKLAGFITALIAFIKTLPVLHADETTDRVGTDQCWMHVLSTSAYTLIHASMSRGTTALNEVGVLFGYQGVVIHDRLALYWKLKTAKHGLCGAHLLRDLADVAVVTAQRSWSSGLAALLVEINHACDNARLAGHKKVAPTLRRQFSARYDTLVDEGIAANPNPPKGTKRNYYQRRSNNLVKAFAKHKTPILRYMHDLDTPMTNNQAERDLRPGKLHRKISGCFRTIEGAQRHANVRSYLSTTRKQNVPAITALTDLFNGTPWMPPQTT